MKYLFTKEIVGQLAAICMVSLSGPAWLGATTVSLVNLGDFGGGKSVASFINNEGDVAGYSYLDINTHHAFIYSGLTQTVKDLETFGGTNSTPGGLNASGEVAGTADLMVNGVATPHAFLYQGSLPLIDLGTLGGTNSAGYGLNDQGVVVGSSLVDQSNTHAMISVTPSDIATLGGSYAEADYINNNGQIAGYSTVGSGSLAFYLPGVRALLATDALTLGGNSSSARGINSIGQVIGTSNLVANSSVQHGFIYTPGDAAPVDLGTLNSSYANGRSDAEAVNAAGQVVGQSDLSLTQHHAYLSTKVGSTWVMTDLGTLNGGLGNSTADAINDFGEVVGTTTNASGATVPFLYMNGTMIDLNSLLALVPNSGFTKLVSATGINDSGVIIGQGRTASGSLDAYILTYSDASLPEPSTITFMGAGLLFFVGLCRRKRGKQSELGA